MIETVMVDDKQKIKKGIIWGFGTLIFREFFLKLVSFVGQIFLARLLFPSDVGIYVIIAFIINVLGLFTDVGLSLGIIQKHNDLTKEELSEAFLLKLSLSSVIIVIIWIFAPYLRVFYPTFSDQNIQMVRIFSLTFLAGSLRLIPSSLLERKIKYNLISLVDVIGVGVYYAISLFFAFFHFGPWSLILGNLAKEYTETVILFCLQPFLPQFNFSIKYIKKMIRFGIYLQGTAMVNIINSSIVPVIGGRTSGTSSVGFLDFAYNIASIPEIIAVNFGRVAFVGYSSIQKEKNLLFSSISKSMSLLAIMLYIFPLVFLGLGQEIVPIVFSTKWLPAIPALYWYSAGTIFLPIISSMGQGILVIGKSKEIFWTSFITAIVGWFGAFLLVKVLGFAGIAAAFSIITAFFSVFYILIFRRANYIFPVIAILFPKLLVLFLSLVVIFSMNFFLPHTFVILVIKLFIAIICYLAFLFLFVRKDTIEFWRLLKDWVAHKKI